MSHKLAIFDIDGTIAYKNVIPESIGVGMTHLHEQGFLTTVSTGRGYARMKDVLGKHFETVVSPESLIILEHGTKIVKRDGTVVRADYFKSNELDHIVDFVRANQGIIRILWFISPDPAVRVQIWCKNQHEIEAETKTRGHYADLFHSSFDELRERLNAFPTSNISVKLEPFMTVENLKLHFTHSDVDVIFQDSMMEFIRNIADKAKAIQYLETHYEVPVADMLIAGNAINDADMLNLPAGHRILVGSGPATDVVLGHVGEHDSIIRVESPEALGTFLQSL